MFDIRTATMFCAALRREVWEAIGPLDERFEVGLFEDDDLRCASGQQGYRVACAEDVFVHHFGQASIGRLARDGPIRRALPCQSARWEAKWGMPWQPHGRRTRRRLRSAGRTRPAAGVRRRAARGDGAGDQQGGRRAAAVRPIAAGGIFRRARTAPTPGIIRRTAMRASRSWSGCGARGADFLLIPETALWWLRHYAQFAEHLEQRYGVRADGAAPGIVVALSERFDDHAVGAEVHGMATPLSRERYRGARRRRPRVRARRVPPGAVVLIASKGDEDLVRIDGYRAWHFPRDEWGSYAGHHPASSVEAIVHLRQLYAQGARYLVFPGDVGVVARALPRAGGPARLRPRAQAVARRCLRHLRASRVGGVRRVRRDGRERGLGRRVTRRRGAGAAHHADASGDVRRRCAC